MQLNRNGLYEVFDSLKEADQFADVLIEDINFHSLRKSAAKTTFDEFLMVPCLDCLDGQKIHLIYDKFESYKEVVRSPVLFAKINRSKPKYVKAKFLAYRNKDNIPFLIRLLEVDQIPIEPDEWLSHGMVGCGGGGVCDVPCGFKQPHTDNPWSVNLDKEKAKNLDYTLLADRFEEHI